MHFNFVNVSSVANRLPSSFDCTIKTLERIAQLYDKHYGGCILINGCRGSGKSYFLRRTSIPSLPILYIYVQFHFLTNTHIAHVSRYYLLL
jgi:hypothetical protein